VAVLLAVIEELEEIMDLEAQLLGSGVEIMEIM
jgi:hypothetical protein